jgi:hypothetical protein
MLVSVEPNGARMVLDASMSGAMSVLLPTGIQMIVAVSPDAERPEVRKRYRGKQRRDRSISHLTPDASRSRLLSARGSGHLTPYLEFDAPASAEGKRRGTV